MTVPFTCLLNPLSGGGGTSLFGNDISTMLFLPSSARFWEPYPYYTGFLWYNVRLHHHIDVIGYRRMIEQRRWFLVGGMTQIDRVLACSRVIVERPRTRNTSNALLLPRVLFPRDIPRLSPPVQQVVAKIFAVVIAAEKYVHVFLLVRTMLWFYPRCTDVQ